MQYTACMWNQERSTRSESRENLAKSLVRLCEAGADVGLKAPLPEAVDDEASWKWGSHSALYLLAAGDSNHGTALLSAVLKAVPAASRPSTCIPPTLLSTVVARKQWLLLQQLLDYNVDLLLPPTPGIGAPLAVLMNDATADIRLVKQCVNLVKGSINVTSDGSRPVLVTTVSKSHPWWTRQVCEVLLKAGGTTVFHPFSVFELLKANLTDCAVAVLQAAAQDWFAQRPPVDGLDGTMAELLVTLVGKPETFQCDAATISLMKHCVAGPGRLSLTASPDQWRHYAGVCVKHLDIEFLDLLLKSDDGAGDRAMLSSLLLSRISSSSRDSSREQSRKLAEFLDKALALGVSVDVTKGHDLLWSTIRSGNEDVALWLVGQGASVLPLHRAELPSLSESRWSLVCVWAKSGGASAPVDSRTVRMAAWCWSNVDMFSTSRDADDSFFRGSGGNGSAPAWTSR